MKRIVVSTSTSCLDYLQVNHGVKSIHQHLFLNNVHFLDGHNISLPRLQSLILQSPNANMRTLPATHEEIGTIFNDLQAQGYEEVLIMTHSIKLSQSYKIINEAKAQFNGRMRIFVIDTKQINISQGMLVLDAAEMFLKGATIIEIEQHLDKLINAHLSLFVVDDLSYLINSKRLKPTAGFFANLLDIKPVLSIQKDGEVKPFDKVRKLQRAIDIMVNQFATGMNASQKFVYIQNAGNRDFVAYLQWVLQDKFGLVNTVITPVSPVSVATHGPNTIGLGMYVNDIPNSARLITTDAF